YIAGSFLCGEADLNFRGGKEAAEVALVESLPPGREVHENLERPAEDPSQKRLPLEADPHQLGLEPQIGVKLRDLVPRPVRGTAQALNAMHAEIADRGRI